MVRRLLAIIGHQWMHMLAPPGYENVPLVSRAEPKQMRRVYDSTGSTSVQQS